MILFAAFFLLTTTAFSLPIFEKAALHHCCFFRENYNKACSLLHCPVQVHITPVTAVEQSPSYLASAFHTFTVDITQSNSLPLSISDIGNIPSRHFPCWIRPAHHTLVYLSSHLQATTSFSISLKKPDNETAGPSEDKEVDNTDKKGDYILVIGLFCLSFIVFLLVFFCYNIPTLFYCMSCVYGIFKLIPCLPDPPHRESESSNSFLYSQSQRHPTQLGPVLPQYTARVLYDDGEEQATEDDDDDELQQEHQHQHRLRTISYTEKEIDTLLENATLSEGEALKLKNDSWICCICLEENATDTKIARLACGHSTHVECLRQWLQKGRPVCCLCKAPAVSSAASSVRGDDNLSLDADPTSSSFSVFFSTVDLQEEIANLTRRRSSISASGFASRDISHLSRRRSSMSASPSLVPQQPTTNFQRRISSMSGSLPAASTSTSLAAAQPMLVGTTDNSAAASSPVNAVESPTVTVYSTTHADSPIGSGGPSTLGQSDSTLLSTWLGSCQGHTSFVKLMRHEVIKERYTNVVFLIVFSVYNDLSIGQKIAYYKHPRRP